MRNAALMLGIVGGLIAMVVGFFGYGYTDLIDTHGEIQGLAEQVDNPQLIRVTSFLASTCAGSALDAHLRGDCADHGVDGLLNTRETDMAFKQFTQGRIVQHRTWLVLDQSTEQEISGPAERALDGRPVVYLENLADMKI